MIKREGEEVKVDRERDSVAIFPVYLQLVEVKLHLVL